MIFHGPMRCEELNTTLKSTISLGRWNGTQVVVKSSLGDGNDFTEELLHEIEVLSSLRHPDLVMFLGACLEDQQISCVTEYSGGDWNIFVVFSIFFNHNQELEFHHPN